MGRRRRGVMSEELKYELAKDLGFYNKVQQDGWGGITTKEAGNMVKRAIQIAEQAARGQQAVAPVSQSAAANPQPAIPQRMSVNPQPAGTYQAAVRTQQPYTPQTVQTGYPGTGQQASFGAPPYTATQSNTNPMSPYVR